MNRAFIFVIIFLALFLIVSPVSAQSIPTFPACPNPGGEIIAKYDSGKHGIPGDAKEYDGADTVFKLNDAMIVQCLCPTSGSGVQTLWWKNPGLSADEESVVLKQGWIRIPNGALWGLDNSVYFAKNSNFNCGGSVNGVGGVSNISASTGVILGASTLAKTGNWMTIIAVFALAIAATITARKLRQTV